MFSTRAIWLLLCNPVIDVKESPRVDDRSSRTAWCECVAVMKLFLKLSSSTSYLQDENLLHWIGSHSGSPCRTAAASVETFVPVLGQGEYHLIC